MKHWAKTAGRVTLLTAGVLAVGSGIANADTTTTGGPGALSGNQVELPISIPVDLSGNAVGILGKAKAQSSGAASVTNPSASSGMSTSGTYSLGGGNQLVAPISVPLEACGNALSVIGTSKAGCQGSATVVNPSDSGNGMKTTGKMSLLGGNQINVPVKIPVNVSCNAGALLGSAETPAGCNGAATVSGEGATNPAAETTTGKASLVGGNQIDTPFSAPVTACSNSAAGLGSASTEAGCSSQTGAFSAPSVSGAPTASDEMLPQTTRKATWIKRFRKVLVSAVRAPRAARHARNSVQATPGAPSPLGSLGVNEESLLGRGLPLNLAGVQLLPQG